MRFKKVCLSTKLSDLYGRDNYQSHIELDREYWCFFEEGTEIYKKTGKYWNKIRISYLRSGIVFYVFPDVPEIAEGYFPVSCYMASALVFAEIDPCKDLENFTEEEYGAGVADVQNIYCFDDEHTIVKNWNNEKIVEIGDDDPIACVMLSTLGKKLDD